MNYKKIFILTIVLLVIIPPLVFSLSIIFPNNDLSLQIKPVIKKVEMKIDSPISKISKEILLSHDGEYGIYVKNLKTGEEYAYNQNKKFNSASLYKLWIMAIALDKIKSGSLNKNEEISIPKYKLDDQLRIVAPTPLPPEVSPSPVPENPEIVTYKLSDAIKDMIIVSDNYAALMVASRSGNLSVLPFLNKYSFRDSNFKQPPQTSAKDIGSFYELLYKGQIIDKENSDQMIEILKMQTLNDRIPKYLPDNIEVAHKTGELLDIKHDAGIVFSNKGDYIVVVLTKTKDSADAAERIALFSKELFKYFSDNK